MLTLRRLATSSAVRSGSTPVTLLGGFRSCSRNDEASGEVDPPTDSSFLNDGTNADVFPILHLAVSISFERGACVQFSPILLIDFVPVSIYAPGGLRLWSGTVTSRNPVSLSPLIDI